MAAWVPEMFRNFYLVKSHKIADNSATAEAREKKSTDLESLEFVMYAYLNLEIIKFYLKSSHKWQMITKLLIGWKNSQPLIR